MISIITNLPLHLLATSVANHLKTFNLWPLSNFAPTLSNKRNFRLNESSAFFITVTWKINFCPQIVVLLFCFDYHAPLHLYRHFLVLLE